ncbi:MAG: MATE family efflux transporter, partial [Anaerolineaceae bacterium]
SIAAVNISASIEQMGYVTFIGLAHACAIMVGNRIGAGENNLAFEYAKRFIAICLAGSLILGLILLISSPVLLNLYAISANAHLYAQNILRIFSLTMWVRIINIVIIIGIVRSGGDTRFSFLVDVLSIWLVGIPMALLGAFVLRLPVYWVYLMVISEELIKMAVMIWRFASRRWMNDLTQPTPA